MIMEKYDYRPNVHTEFTAEEEDRFRKLMNKWACSIKGYNRRKFGDELKILDVWDTPIYVSSLDFQCDMRIIEHVYKNYNNEMLEPRTVFTENDFNRWDVCDAPKPFTDGEASFWVPGSRHIEKCVTCNGTKTMKCTSCDNGQLTCVRCNGYRKIKKIGYRTVPCKHCKGTGYQIINESSFTNSVTVDKSKPCMYCHDGENQESYEYYDTCTKCGGTGTTACPICHGTGGITCTTCEGTGKLLYYWVVRQKALAANRKTFIMPYMLSDNDVDKYMAAYDRTDGKLVFKQCNDGISYNKDEFDQQDFTGEALLKLTENLKNTEKTHIVYNEFSTIEIEAKTVKYELDGKEYMCVLQGETWDIFSVKSPISDFMDEIKKDVISLSERGRIGKAWTLTKRLLQFPQAGENELNVKERLEECLKNATVLGKKLSIIIFLLAIFPIFIAQYNNSDYIIVSQWTHWIDNFLHVTHAMDVLVFAAFDVLCMMLFGLIGTPSFLYKHENFFVRMLFGVLFGLASQAVIYLIFFGLRWFGIVSLFDFVFYWLFVIILYAILIIYLIFRFIIKLVVGLFKWIF